MAAQIDELVRMRDVDSLLELMEGDEEWVIQLEAAGGLVKLGDRRSYEFLLTALVSDDEEIREVAEEIFAAPELIKMRDEIEAERQHEHRTRLESARKRLQNGGKVFRYKTIYLPSGAIAGDDALGKGFAIPALDEHGLEGWEVIHVLPSRRATLAISTSCSRRRFCRVKAPTWRARNSESGATMCMFRAAIPMTAAVGAKLNADPLCRKQIQSLPLLQWTAMAIGFLMVASTIDPNLRWEN
jgi:hypothetical protein